MRATAGQSRCNIGVHRPRPVRGKERGIQRSSCIDCNCALMRTAATRRWFLSGMIG